MSPHHVRLAGHRERAAPIHGKPNRFRRRRGNVRHAYLYRPHRNRPHRNRPYRNRPPENRPHDNRPPENRPHQLHAPPAIRLRAAHQRAHQPLMFTLHTLVTTSAVEMPGM